VNFGSPLSARDFLRDRGVDPRMLPREARFRHVDTLAREIMAGIGEVIPALPTSLVATAFLHDPDATVDELELKARVHGLMAAVEEAGGRIYVPRGNRDYAVSVGLRMLVLRRIVMADDGLYRVRPGELPILRYYAHSIAHLLEEAVVPA
jgi:glycerol-3-phosphate O-acyltransferase